MRLLVTGGSGLLGHKIVLKALEKGYEVIATYNMHEIPFEKPNLRKVKLDISNTVLLEDLILKTRPEVIIHCAAYTDVDGCEINKLCAWKVNVEATRSIVLAARVTRAYLIYISTDYVFNGEKGLYKENDAPNPVNYYGLTKLIAEQLVVNRDLLYCIVRPSAIYGLGLGKKNFATFVVEKLSKGEVVKAVVDQYVSPTFNTLLAEALLEIAQLKPVGVFHIAGERMSRYDFAVKLDEVLDLPKENIMKANVSDLKWVAKRPRDSSLDISKAASILKVKFYDTELALNMFKEEYGGS